MLYSPATSWRGAGCKNQYKGGDAYFYIFNIWGEQGRVFLTVNLPCQTKRTTGVGVNGCRRAKHITGGGKDEEAGRDRHLPLGILGGLGTFVKSPEPYLTPDQNRKEAL